MVPELSDLINTQVHGFCYRFDHGCSESGARWAVLFVGQQQVSWQHHTDSRQSRLTYCAFGLFRAYADGGGLPERMIVLPKYCIFITFRDIVLFQTNQSNLIVNFFMM